MSSILPATSGALSAVSQIDSITSTILRTITSSLTRLGSTLTASPADGGGYLTEAQILAAASPSGRLAGLDSFIAALAAVVNLAEGASVYSAPLVTTGAAAYVTATDAVLTGTVIPSGLGTSVVFNYGVTTGYGLQTPAGPGGYGQTATTPRISFTGLTPETTYHYQISATNALGTTVGTDQTFTTTSA